MASIPKRIKRNRKLVPIRKYFKVFAPCLAYRIFWSAYISNKKRITINKEVENMRRGYKLYKQYSGINLIKDGFESYSVKGNTQLGKLIRQAQSVLKNCVVWYEVINLASGTVNIIYKEA